MKTIFFVLLMNIFLSSADVLAGDSSEKIAGVMAGTAFKNKNLIFIKMALDEQDKAACSANPGWDYTFEIVSNVGKATLDLVLAAYQSGRSVIIDGTDACELFADVEGMRRILLI